MRYTRFEFKGKVGIGRSIFKFFILIPLIAIVLGWLLPNLFIMINQAGSRGPESNTESYSYEDVRPEKFFLVQTGIYSSEDNAKSAENIIRSRHLPAYTYMDGQYYRVISYIGDSKNAADTKRQEYIKQGLDCIVKELYITPSPVKKDIKQDKELILLNRMLNSCGEASSACCSMYLKYESSQIDSKSLKQSLMDTDKKINETLREFKATEVSGNAFYNKMSSMCQSFEKSLIGENISGEFSAASFEEKIIRSIYIYNDIIKSYNDNINGTM